MKYDIFLSYARMDEIQTGKVKQIYDILCESGFKVWWDKVEMSQRELAFTEEIGNVIKNTERLILFVGEHMLASEYVDEEWRYARKCGVKVYPVLIFDNGEDKYSSVPQRLKRMHIRDLTDATTETAEIEKLIADLKYPLSPLAPLLNVPALPAGYVEREEKLDELVEYFFNDRAENIGDVRACSLSGMGGSGKSTIANALCHDEEIRRHFEKIFWINVGDNGTLISAWRQIAAFSSLPTDLDEFEMRKTMTSMCANKRCLFVFDNCANPQIVEFFKNALDVSRNRMLLTLRESTLSNAFGMKNFRAGMLTQEEALKLVAGYCHIKFKDLDENAYEFINAVERHALALAMGAAMYMEFGDWKFVIQSYYDAEEEFDIALPNYEYRNVLVSIEASYKSLSNDMATLFMMLSVFKKEIKIPVKQITMLWETQIKRLYCDNEDIRRRCLIILKKLKNKELISFDSNDETVTLHNLIYEYQKRKQKDDTVLLSFIEKIQGCKDSYYYNFILYHLLKSGNNEAARELLFDYDYQINKISKIGINSLLLDFDYWDDEEVNTLHKFYNLSSYVIKLDKKQLVSQLFGRFCVSSEFSSISKLMTKAYETTEPPFLVPIDVCMMPPGTAETDTIRLENKVFSLKLFNKKLLVSDKSGTVTIIDAERCVEEKVIKKGLWCLDAFMFDSCIVILSDKKRITIYDLEKEEATDYLMDSLVLSCAVTDKCFYVGNSMGKITVFNSRGPKESFCCGCGISCLYSENDESVTVYCINKKKFILTEGKFEFCGITEERIVKRQGDITLSSHGRIYIEDRRIDALGVVKDFDDDICINSEQKIIIFDKKDGTVLKEFKSNNEVKSVCKKENNVFVSDNTQNIYKWNLQLPQWSGDDTKKWILSMASHNDDVYYIRQNGKIYKNEEFLSDKSQWYNAIEITDEHIITANNIGEIMFFDKKNLELKELLKYGNKVTDMESDNEKLYVADALGVFAVFDIKSLDLLMERKIGSFITSVSLLNDMVAFSDRYGHIAIYNRENIELVKTIKTKEEINCITAYGNYLVVAFKNNKIKLLDVETEKVICEYYPSFSEITEIFVHKEILYVCTEAGWQKVKLITKKAEKI